MPKPVGKPGPAKSSREKVRDYRARKRAQGYRLIQRWVRDTRTPEFRAEAHRQSLAVARSEHAEADQSFVDELSEGVLD